MTDDSPVVFEATVRIDAEAELEYYARGGILRMVLGDMLERLIRSASAERITPRSDRPS